jgi:hypothetical protein
VSRNRALAHGDPMSFNAPERFRGYRDSGYRDKCLRWAKAAGTEEDRITLLHTAEGWEQAAQQIEDSVERIAVSRKLLNSAWN